MSNVQMNPAVKKDWVAALRSGKYKQTQGTLKNGRTNSFCCLGVLCDIHASTGLGKGRWSPDGMYQVDDEVGRSLCPPIVDKWANISSEGTTVTIDGHLALLMVHNDKGASFEKIADAIEEQL